MSDHEFNTDEPLAYFITWRTYGTWLPGDERGWKRKGDPDRHAASPLHVESAQCKTKETAFLLARNDRDIVLNTITKHCEIRNWVLHTADARTNHVHVVVSASGYKPETVRDQLKAWCTRKLKPAYPDRERFWAEGASRRYLNTDNELEAAIIYVEEAQDNVGLEE